MTRTVHEARTVATAARGAKVATQMSVQSCASDEACSRAELAVLGNNTLGCPRRIAMHGKKTESPHVRDKHDAGLRKVTPDLIVAFFRKRAGLDVFRGQLHFASDHQVITVAVVKGQVR